MSMFCFQCQEAAKGSGCTLRGVCGKTDDVANLQDLLLYVLKGISAVGLKARELELNTEAADQFVMKSLFATITNANFDDAYFASEIRNGLKIRDALRDQLENVHDLPSAAIWSADSEADFKAQAKLVGVLSTINEDIRSLRELIVYGLKGMSAYTKHAMAIGYNNNAIHAFIAKALAATLDDELTVDNLVALVMETGKFGVDAMALLDQANTTAYGNPEITQVALGTRGIPGILVSGHDLRDLEELLQQTEGTGIDIYTHSEMLPAHYYPALKKYKHLVGNYGNAWWKQDKEFESFNGPILMTTNCLVPPKSSYQDRVYITGVVGFPGLTRIEDRKENGSKDFSAIIQHAKKCAPPTQLEEGTITGGFAHNQVVALADKIVEAIKLGSIKKFVVMAGCDGRMKSREYYTEFAEQLPKDAVILTAGCAKYRYNKLDLVEWTTPVLLSGYASTGSIAGSVLQAFNLCLGTLCYVPFVLLAEKAGDKRARRKISETYAQLQQGAEQAKTSSLLARQDDIGDISRALAADLEHALNNNGLMLFYQPQVHYCGEVLGVEALLRWKHSSYGFISPVLVIALAEEAQLMDRLGYWIMDTAGADLKELDNMGLCSLSVSINVSALQFESDSFVADLTEVVQRHQIDPGRFEIELTEQIALFSNKKIAHHLQSLRRLGVKLAMDDFGMGHSSLIYLKEHQFDTVKLDGSLVQEILTNPTCCNIIKSIVSLGESLNYSVIAEYVETEDQRQLLHELGCNRYQGCLFSPAVPLRQLENLIKNSASLLTYL